MANYLPFLTGSRIYGTPRADSDIDLVILADPVTLIVLRTLAPETESKYAEDSTDIAFKFGNLNVIAFSDPVKFQAWRNATIKLTDISPVTRDVAIKVIDDEIAAAYTEHNYGQQKARQAVRGY